MEEANLGSNRFLCGECPTRWNSKHDMLKVECPLREVFFKYELEDDCYYRDLERVKKMLEYNMSSESPLPDDALNAMVREMLKEIVKRMGVLFQIRFDTVVSKSSSKRTKNQQSCKSYIRGNDFLDDFLNLEDVGSTE
ncbi:hypothetical protein CTI12_AA329650 [Artemisia annua]|uniref:Uncharacterized protein n=1 Tax=Artemisia annua TaxID=35608 RepID=A0A2U1MY07_ARTAN|nr:hypothetical protein CTI12_AA329650 [Artemisia annua]